MVDGWQVGEYRQCKNQKTIYIRPDGEHFHTLKRAVTSVNQARELAQTQAAKARGATITSVCNHVAFGGTLMKTSKGETQPETFQCTSCAEQFNSCLGRTFENIFQDEKICAELASVGPDEKTTQMKNIYERCYRLNKYRNTAVCLFDREKEQKKDDRCCPTHTFCIQAMELDFRFCHRFCKSVRLATGFTMTIERGRHKGRPLKGCDSCQIEGKRRDSKRCKRVRTTETDTNGNGTEHGLSVVSLDDDEEEDCVQKRQKSTEDSLDPEKNGGCSSEVAADMATVAM